MKTFILPTLIILSFLFSCHRQKEEVKNEPTAKLDTLTLKQEFKPVLADFIYLLNEDRSSETNIVVTISYLVFDKEYILLVNDFAYNSEFLKGYTEYNDYLICYYGFDDCIAEKIFYYDNLKTITPSNNYEDKKDMKDLHSILFDPFAKYYHIDDHNNINAYEPSPKILQEFVNISVQHGLIPAVPPKP